MLLSKFFYLQNFAEAWELLNAIDPALKKSMAHSRELLNAHLQILSRCVQTELCVLRCEHFFETGVFLSREASRASSASSTGTGAGTAPAAYSAMRSGEADRELLECALSAVQCVTSGRQPQTTRCWKPTLLISCAVLVLEAGTAREREQLVELLRAQLAPVFQAASSCARSSDSGLARTHLMQFTGLFSVRISAT